jgi:predicted enzyme related to lactoylglutathione lyase
MQLGAFSISLNVKDIRASLEFYQKLGFAAFGGNIEENWLILRNGDCVIGLFQGMFDRNIITFNPGWDGDAQPLADYTDVRALRERIAAAGIPVVTPAEESPSGPAYFTVTDPDGNPILFDQHV